MAISSTYCTHRDVKDVFPNMDDYDVKNPVYGWIEVSSNKYAAHNSGLVTQLFADGEDLGPAQSAHTDLNVEGEWFYNSAEDVCYYYSASTPLDKLMEAGEEFSTLVTRIMKNASRFLDARLDANLPRDQFRDKEGNFDYMIVRTAALLSAKFLIKAQEPTNPLADEFDEEVKENIEALNTGQTRLSGNVTGDASKGIVREVVAPQNSNGLHIVDTRGHYAGIYDLIKVVINTAGAIGTAKFDVYGSSTDSLKATKIVDARIINGQYQHIGNGLEIRFAGKNSSSSATAGGTPDEWEIEVWGRMEAMDDNIGNVRSVKMTRGGVGRRVYRNI
jgi:hypothetical protein